MAGRSKSSRLSRPNASTEKIAQLITDLQSEQSRLSAEVEQTLLQYDNRTQVLAKRLAAADDDLDEHQIERFRSDQEGLWRTVRRLQAALRATRELETELREWASRTEADDRIGHPDHPATRIEIVASELRSRGRDPFAYLQSIRTKRFDGSAKDANPIEEILADQQTVAQDDEEAAFDNIAKPNDLASEEESLVPEWHRLHTDNLIREIRDAAREAKRMKHAGIFVGPHARRNILADDGDASLGATPGFAQVKADDEVIAELARTIADYRRYHGHLKMSDRIDGIRRNRLAIAPLEV